MQELIKRLIRDEGGGFLVPLALCLTVLFWAIGSAVDYSGYLRKQSRARLAAESALLHATKELIAERRQDFDEDGRLDLTISDMEAVLENHFSDMFGANFQGWGDENPTHNKDRFSIRFDTEGEVAAVKLGLDYDTYILSMFGYPKLPININMNVQSVVSMDNFVVDVVMCIDATGSMQPTLDAVRDSALTFNTNLRAALGIGTSDQRLKVRVRPIFYRDRDDTILRAILDELWESAPRYRIATRTRRGRTQIRAYYDANGDYLRVPFPLVTEDQLPDSTKITSSRTYDRGSYQVAGSTLAARHYYFLKDDVEANQAWKERAAPKGLVSYPGFFDLDPVASSGDMREGNSELFRQYVASEVAAGGWDEPEAAGACLHQATNSPWFDIRSDDAREYFRVPQDHIIISEGDEEPDGPYSKITHVPVVVFWTDQGIASLPDTAQIILPGMPTTYQQLEDDWNDVTRIPQLKKKLLLFTDLDEDGFKTGWDEVEHFTKFKHIGSLTDGNSMAVELIAESIKDILPNALRVGL